ncbi:MAG: hypothetical protein HY913_10615 [Desulfomonile tiedjei]|nr:hypothetical protein [Desulfomonile tiedjei]
MVKRVFSIFLCVMMLSTASLAFAGGAPAVAAAPCAPAYPAKAYAPAGNPCAYWGDAPFPGLCGGIVALPFLVVGSLLGGNTVGPYPPVPGPGYAYRGAPAPCPPPVKVYAPPAAPGCAPPACGPAGYGPPAYGPAAYGGGILSGLPCLELCSSLLGMGGGGPGLFY